MIKLTSIKPNPNNPRIIRDERFAKLVNSIKEFPKMMELRPMVVDADMIVLGGNMRLKALQEAGYSEVPDSWVKSAEDLTPEEQRRFIISDNVGFGEHDWEMLANEWDKDELSDWGLEVLDMKAEDEPSEPVSAPAIELKIVFDDLQVYDTVKIEIEELLKSYQGVTLK